MASSDAPPSGLWRALATGVTELERLLARGGQGVGLLGSLVALHVTVFVSFPTGAILLAVTLSALGWYTLSHHLLGRGANPVPLRLATAVLEVSLPVVALVVLWVTQGAEYALGSWVPPQLWTVFVAASILRLDARVPVVMATLASGSYAALWFAVLRPSVVSHDLLLYRDDMQLVRVGSLLLTGLAASGAVVVLRRVIDRASVQLRAEDLFGKYRLGPEIASGGMGKVLEATYCPEGGFQRRVAVKLIHPHLATDPEFVDRFRKEAELGARLTHPNIVSTLDFGRVGDTYFLAMEFVDGRPLSELLRERKKAGAPLPARVVAWIASQVASGLEHAHTKATDDAGRTLRVVHRDLSPANVLLDRSGRVRITDFGVSRALGDTTRLHTRQLVGKPGYVPPESLNGTGVDPRSDLWSFGVLIWEMLSNERLFARESEAAALFAVVEGAIPPLKVARPDLGPAWQVLVDQLLQRDRDQRLESATLAREMLDVLLAGEGLPDATELARLVAPEDEVPELPLD
jgi:serine/threonine-protein kinase